MLEAYERLILDTLRGRPHAVHDCRGDREPVGALDPAARGSTARQAVRARLLGPERDPPAGRAQRLAAAVRARLAREPLAGAARRGDLLRQVRVGPIRDVERLGAVEARAARGGTARRPARTAPRASQAEGFCGCTTVRWTSSASAPDRSPVACSSPARVWIACAETGKSATAARASLSATPNCLAFAAANAALSASADRSGCRTRYASTTLTTAIAVTATIVGARPARVRRAGDAGASLRSSGPRPASQPAASSAGTVTPGKNHVQSSAELIPKATTTPSSPTIPSRSGSWPRPGRPIVRPAAVAHATSNARLSTTPTRPKSENASITYECECETCCVRVRRAAG